MPPPQHLPWPPPFGRDQDERRCCYSPNAVVSQMAVDHDRRSSGLRAFDRGTLSLFSSNAHKLTKPIAAEPNFNMPPVRQIGELDPFAVVPKSTPLESAPIAPAQAQTTTDVALRQPADVSGPLSNASADAAETASPVDLRPGRIGKSAVNVRSGPPRRTPSLAFSLRALKWASVKPTAAGFMSGTQAATAGSIPTTWQEARRRPRPSPCAAAATPPSQPPRASKSARA